MGLGETVRVFGVVVEGVVVRGVVVVRVRKGWLDGRRVEVQWEHRMGNEAVGGLGGMTAALERCPMICSTLS